MLATRQSVSKKIFSTIKSLVVNVIYLHANFGELIASIVTDQTLEHLFRSRTSLSSDVNSPATSINNLVTLIINADP